MPIIINTNFYQVDYGRNTIHFSVEYYDRKTIEIAVYPDCSVKVKAPKSVKIETIKDRVSKRARWITNQQLYFSQFHPRAPARQYVNGETHLYLGRRYRLKVIDKAEGGVSLSHGLIHINCSREPTPEKVKMLLQNWYIQKARYHFEKSVERCQFPFQELVANIPKVSMRTMKTRWGSLSRNGRITLNTQLIKAPLVCIDYVVTHELCHLKYPNHSKEFYQLLSHIIPDWQQIKNRLEKIIAQG